MSESGPPVQAVRTASLVAPAETNVRLLSGNARVSNGSADKSQLLQQQRITVEDIEAAQPFAWSRCLVSLVSYALLLSEVVRSGLGTQKKTLSEFPVPEPDAILHFGPYAYSILNLSTSDLSMQTKSTVNVWAYKFDTTSVSMRSVADVLEAPKWPPCFHYRDKCGTGDGFLATTAFDMIDSLIDSLASHRSTQGSNGHLSVRMEYEWVDRLHHFVFPWFFRKTVKRTTQAIHYRFDRLTQLPSICGHPSGRQPYACGEAWTKFRHLCNPSTNAHCVEVTETVWSHIELRMAQMLTLYANHSIELAVIEGADDYTRPGITFQGRKLVDIVALVRVLKCQASKCSTVAVEDYRYEAATMAITAADWFGMVALCRGAGQLYAWVRLASLWFGVYYGFQSNHISKPSMWDRICATTRTVFIVPSQVVIYGSVFPILCYVWAHLLDSCAVYELVALHFNSPLGYFHFDLGTFVRLCSVSMRSLWTLTLVLHLIVAAYSRRSWSPVRGVPGIPEFSISFVSSLTVFAQSRSTAWRSTRILHAYEVVPSTHRHRWQTISYATPRTPLNKLFLGSTIDAQCLLGSFLLLFLIMIVSRVATTIMPQYVKRHIALSSRTLVPYSAGTLWLTNGLVVCWNGAIMVRYPSPAEKPLAPPRTSSLLHALSFRSLRKVHYFPWRTSSTSTVEMAIANTEVSFHLQRDMQSVSKRSREVEAMVFLLNLAMMTDPISFCRLRAVRGRLVALYRSKSSDRLFVIPLAVSLTATDIPIDFTDLVLVSVLNSKSLPWQVLLQCG